MSSLALLVGIDDYPDAPLTGCVNDANRVRQILESHYDGQPNFSCRTLASDKEKVTRARLREGAQALFSKRADIALFYFAGHGTANNLGGYLVTTDAQRYDEGVPMGDVLKLANESTARERIVVLDCCHAGAFGEVPAINNSAILAEGVTILAACRDTEVAVESGRGGVFTILVCQALEGGAADVCGKVTVASVYAFVDEVFEDWEQRPLFKSHVSRLAPIRKCEPSVEPHVLRKITEYFPSPTHSHSLDRSYEPTAKPSDQAKEEIFRHLQMMNRARLVVSVGAQHMYDAAMSCKACKLTPLGRFYWHRVRGRKV